MDHEELARRAQDMDRDQQAQPRYWVRYILFAAVGLTLGLLAAIPAGSGPGPEPQVIDLGAEQVQRLDERSQQLDQRSEQLNRFEAELEAWEKELAQVAEARVTVSDGVWAVGVDIEPGTYRATDVGPSCYWDITVSGSNGMDIISNGYPGGGNPTVNLEAGQDFTTDQCGEWTKQ